MGPSNHISLVRDTGSSDNGQTERRPGKNGPDAASTAPGETTAPDSVVSVLAQAIQHEIIPRLMLAHRTPVECSAPYDNIAEAISPADVSDFAQVLLKGSEANALQWIEDLRHKGSSRRRYRNSPHFRGAKTSEALRICETDRDWVPILLYL